MADQSNIARVHEHDVAGAGTAVHVGGYAPLRETQIALRWSYHDRVAGHRRHLCIPPTPGYL